MRKSMVLGIMLSCLLVTVTSCTKTQASGDGLKSSSIVQTFTDPITNCMYLTTTGGGITPRYNAKGGHLGCQE